MSDQNEDAPIPHVAYGPVGLQLAAIRQRLLEAPPGPWRWQQTYEVSNGGHYPDWHWCLGHEHSAPGTFDPTLVLMFNQNHYRGKSPTDNPTWSLIAHAPTDIAVLLEALDAQEEEIAFLAGLVADQREESSAYRRGFTDARDADCSSDLLMELVHRCIESRGELPPAVQEALSEVIVSLNADKRRRDLESEPRVTFFGNAQQRKEGGA